MRTLMPNLFKYFITVGAILFVGLVGLNAVLEPGGPGPRMVQDSPKAKLVRHDPRASLVERLREEEAGQKASGKAEAKPLLQPATVIPTAPSAPAQPVATEAAAVAQPQPVKAIAQPPQPVKQAAIEPAAAAPAEPQTAPAALTGVATDEEAARAIRTQEKAAAEKARKKRIARDRARTKAIEDAAASRQQDQYYAQRPAYAYAPPPRPLGPFSQNQGGLFGGGWGRGW
jgi:hypothetical protein